MKATMIKIQDHQPIGKYNQTKLDTEKTKVDFRLIQISPCVIRWNDGHSEIINQRKLTSLQKKYTWMSDF